MAERHRSRDGPELGPGHDASNREAQAMGGDSAGSLAGRIRAEHRPWELSREEEDMAELGVATGGLGERGTGTLGRTPRAEVRARRHGEQQERPWRWELGRREEQRRGTHQGAERTGWTEGDAAKSARNPAMDAGIHGGGTAGEERSREGASWAGAMREAGERDGRESPTAGG